VIAYLDTHVAVWLHAGLVDRLSTEAKRRIEECDLLLTPMALLELQYLYERKRIAVDAISAFGYLNTVFGRGARRRGDRLDFRSLRPHHRWPGESQSQRAPDHGR